MLCSIEGCPKASRKRGWCETHYKRWLRSRSPRRRYMTARPGASTAERFWSKVDRSGACWLWLGTIGPQGYGRFVLSSGLPVAYAHRIAYQLTWGAIGDGLTIDHLCRNRGCVNPSHLEAVTQGENIRRAIEDRVIVA